MSHKISKHLKMKLAHYYVYGATGSVVNVPPETQIHPLH